MLTSVRFSFYYDTVHVVRVGDVDDTDWRTKCDSHVSISGISISGAFCLPSSSEKICTYSLSAPLERTHVGHESAGAGPSTACCVPIYNEPIVSSLVRAVDEQSEDDATDDQGGY